MHDYWKSNRKNQTTQTPRTFAVGFLAGCATKNLKMLEWADYIDDLA